MEIGILRKLKVEHKSIVEYSLPLSDKLIPLNELIGKKVTIAHTGKKICLDSGRELKKTFGQGYSWESFTTLPECDQCIFKPELCHYSKGTCRDSKWGETHCLQPHVIYLSLTSDLKIGITRKTQVPNRWIDQGAVKAIKLLEVKDRLTSGKIEIEIAKSMSDKTNWRNMLKNVYEDRDLLAEKKKVLSSTKDLIEKYQATVMDDEIYEFNYPVEIYPEKVSSLNFDKNPTVEGVLMGIKGQYLIFDSGVINIRKFGGYEVELLY
jgi:hypothetical protein